MIQTDSGKYAVRALCYIANRDDPTLPVSAAEIAESEQVPPYYLAKVLQDLARHGVLHSVRGRRGGFRLQHAPADVSLLQILEAVEDVSRVTEDCVLGLEFCNDDVPCPLHDAWKEFRTRIVKQLRDMSLADLVIELEKKRDGA